MRPLALAALALLALLTPRALAGETVRLIAVDTSGTFDDTPEPDLPDLSIGSSANGWDPAATRASAKRKRDGRAEWLFDLPRAFVRAEVEFKFTRGSWDTVETARDGADIPNRTLLFPKADEVTVEIAGFADTRPGAPNGAGSTVVGSLDIFTIESTHLASTRTVRVWLPEQYARDESARFPVLYMHDGQNCFDDATSFAGEWRVDETLTDLAADGAIPPTIAVAIDNSGPRRSLDYLPFPPGARRPDMPGGGADAYVAFLVDELIPLINSRYRTRTGPDHTAIGGSSFGGVITLHAVMTRPAVFGAALVESPSLWVGDGKLIDAIAQHTAPWPDRMCIAMGTREYANAEHDTTLLSLLDQTVSALRAQGLDDTRLRVVIDEGARHNELAWRTRLPAALRFLLTTDTHPEPNP